MVEAMAQRLQQGRNLDAAREQPREREHQHDERELPSFHCFVDCMSLLLKLGVCCKSLI